MSTYDALPKTYDPQAVEPKWYTYWVDKGYFHAEVDPSKEMYSITIPPPNITGSLHIGHALCYTIQDVLGRWKRMQGFNTLILPGTDHAGIATQNKVEQALAKEGLSRHDLGREKFVERVWEWREEYGGIILEQFKRMGYAFDWDRLRFTMDPEYADAVLEEFIRWFDKGLIYRGVRVINWCPRCQTAISDIEIEYEEVAGHLWHIDYPLEDGSGVITVATTRPETMLGDTGIAVNPEDQRYMGMVGKNAILPIMNRAIPIVADVHVDPDFGTGAVKVTPAHDPNDFEIGIRHNLPQIIVIGTDGSMTEEAGEFAGMDRYAARDAIVTELRAKGLLVLEEEYVHSVGTCARCGSVIEPLLSEQWFAKMKKIAQPAIDVVKEGRVRFVPDRYAGLYLDWMENIRDWCISRQLWWGHRIPVWKCLDCGEYTAAKTEVEACSKCGCKNVEQDPDVLDTWFSSALWPFATMGWPKQTPELDYFYPTSVLTTARDIIYLWVSRMIMTSMYFLNEIPFKDVYIYATVMNEEGRRMSKSLGTGVDPLEIIDKYGADALRFALLQQAGKGQDIRFSEGRVEPIRNFCNKIWNMSRFVLLNLEDLDGQIPATPSPQEFDAVDVGILGGLRETILAVNTGLEGYDMDNAAHALYDFLWSDFADWYIEQAKGRLRGHDRPVVQYILWRVLETTMRLLHPMMPHITEQIWQSIPHGGDSIMVAEYPRGDEPWFMISSLSRNVQVLVQAGQAFAGTLEHEVIISPPIGQEAADVLRKIGGVEEERETAPSVPSVHADMDNVFGKIGRAVGLQKDLVRAIRSLRAEIGTNPSATIKAVFVPSSEDARLAVQWGVDNIRTWAKVSDLEIASAAPTGERTASAHLPMGDVYVPLAGLVDMDKEIARLTNELAEVERDLSRSQGKLSNEQFVSKAPAQIIEKERRIVAELSDKKERLEQRLGMLRG